MNSGPIILSIETTTPGGGVCISRGSLVLASTTGNAELSHSNTLLSDIETCVSEAGLSLNDVELFAAASGPGSFTGLRIGLATIKGLSATLERRCVGVPTLHAIAHAAGASRATVALLPAGRGELFVQLLAASGDEVIELDAPAHLSPERAIERYGSLPAVKWAGPGARVQQALIEKHANLSGHRMILDALPGTKEVDSPGWLVVGEGEHLARHVAAVAWQRFKRGDVEEAETLSAIYVRPSDAELKCQ